MKLLINAFIFFLLALVFDAGLFLLNRMKPSSCAAAFLAKRLERLADIISRWEKIILKGL